MDNYCFLIPSMRVSDLNIYLKALCAHDAITPCSLCSTSKLLNACHPCRVVDATCIRSTQGCGRLQSAASTSAAADGKVYGKRQMKPTWQSRNP